MNVGAMLASLSKWIDAANAHRDPEARTWGRLGKVTEETGELTDEMAGLILAKMAIDSANGRLIAAMIGYTGQNPRKGVTHTREHVVKELYDIATTALCAVEHMNENDGTSVDGFGEHVLSLMYRANLTEDLECTVCGRDNRNGTHDALVRTGHLSHDFTTVVRTDILSRYPEGIDKLAVNSEYGKEAHNE
jgi:hypothetical protein